MHTMHCHGAQPPCWANMPSLAGPPVGCEKHAGSKPSARALQAHVWGRLQPSHLFQDSL